MCQQANNNNTLSFLPHQHMINLKKSAGFLQSFAYVCKKLKEKIDDYEDMEIDAHMVSVCIGLYVNRLR